MNSYISSFLIHIFSLSFFLFFILIFSFIFFFHHFFICSPWTLNCIVPTSSPMVRCLLVLRQRGDRDKVGTRNIFPWERYLKSSTLAPSCDLPSIDDPYSYVGCGQGGKHKRWYFWFKGWISGEVCEISYVGIHNACIKMLAKR
jgi:hypothetical protein